jgi:hypothetical protein
LAATARWIGARESFFDFVVNLQTAPGR